MKKTGLVLVLLAASISTFASVNAEKMQLARINSVLNTLYPMMAKAQSLQSQSDNIQFNYGRLISDVKAIQKGIAQKVNSLDLTPRIVKPLNTKFVEKS